MKEAKEDTEGKASRASEDQKMVEKETEYVLYIYELKVR
jgi:hypothetical protein